MFCMIFGDPIQCSVSYESVEMLIWTCDLFYLLVRFAADFGNHFYSYGTSWRLLWCFFSVLYYGLFCNSVISVINISVNDYLRVFTNFLCHGSQMQHDLKILPKTDVCFKNPFRSQLFERVTLVTVRFKYQRHPFCDSFESWIVNCNICCWSVLYSLKIFVFTWRALVWTLRRR